MTLICCRWCTRCAAAASALIRAPPNRLAITACRNATPRSPSCRSSSAAPSAWHEIASPKWKARTFDAHHVNYPRTEKGNPSFKAGKLGWMATHPHWLPQLIATANKYDHAGSTFLEGHILEHLIGGRIYAEINPHRSEDGGTRSFRFSYSNPPLQQMPSRDKELGPLIRSVFLPEEGEIWCTLDFSQQEFRFVVHHAVMRNLPGAKEAVERYRNDPDADFHAIVAEMTGLIARRAKGVNFAKIYGAGVKKFAEMIGKPLAEAQAIIRAIRSAACRSCRAWRRLSERGRERGYTVLYDGARRHWNFWAPGGAWPKGAGPCSHEEAMRRGNDPEHPWFYDSYSAPASTPRSTRKFKATPRGIPNCGCAPAGAKASCRCCRCTTGSNARSRRASKAS